MSRILLTKSAIYLLKLHIPYTFLHRILFLYAPILAHNPCKINNMEFKNHSDQWFKNQILYNFPIEKQHFSSGNLFNTSLCNIICAIKAACCKYQT